MKASITGTSLFSLFLDWLMTDSIKKFRFEPRSSIITELDLLKMFKISSRVYFWFEQIIQKYIIYLNIFRWTLDLFFISTQKLETATVAQIRYWCFQILNRWPEMTMRYPESEFRISKTIAWCGSKLDVF